MKTRIDKASGAAGEISPWLRARSDLGRYQTGDRRVENFVVLPEGGRTRRPGTKFIDRYKNEALTLRLVPFEAGPADAYMLAFNGGVMRVFTNGGRVETSPGFPYELPHPFAESELPNLQFCQSRGISFIARDGVPQRLTRISNINWTLEDYPYTAGPVRQQNLDKTKTIIASAAFGSITLTAAGHAPFLPGHVGSTWRIDEADLSSVPAWRAGETVVAFSFRRNRGRIYQAVIAGTDTGPNPPTHDDGDVSSGGTNTTWRYISDTGGYVKITGVTSPTVATGTVVKILPLSTTTIASYRWYEAAWSNVRGWPQAVGLSDQALVWALEDQIWITRTTDIYSFDLYDDEDAALNFTINAPDGKLVVVQWVLSSGVLVLGTRSTEWVIRGEQTYSNLTAATARAVPMTSETSTRQQPCMVDGGAVFISRDRRRLNFAKFDPVAERIDIQEFTAFSRHMLRKLALQLADQRDPHRVLWTRRGDGLLVGVTLQPEQEVTGWHRHPMLNGFVEQVACVQSADETWTETWLAVRRTINGVTRRYIELMQPYFEAIDEDEPTAEGAWFLDCALEYNGPAVTVITGLSHLEGQTVGIVAMGNELPRQIVTAGSITLTRASTHALVGIPIRGFIGGLPLDTNTQKGTSKGVSKSSNRAYVQCYESAGGALASNGGPPDRIFDGGGIAPGTPQPLASELVAVTIEPSAGLECSIDLICDDAMPFTYLGLTPDLDLKDA